MSAMGGKKVLYAAFDAYPGSKGAQAHIRTNLLAIAHGGGLATLLCLGQGGSFRDPDSGAMVHAFAVGERNMLRRSELFGRFLVEMADRMIADPPDVIHFRDIWSGIPLLSHPISRNSRIVFEVNGLPSVELPNHYPRLADNSPLLARLRWMEDECLARSDSVITVCRRTSRYLVERGCDKGKITEIPNAADPGVASETLPIGAAGFEEAAANGEKVILYVGTLAPWQGLQTLLEAMTHLGRRNDFRLVVAASGRKGVKRLRRQAVAKGLITRVTILDGVHHAIMPNLYQRAYLSVAPLARGARNELQGCCPLKVVESMVQGTPVVASDLPVVRELICPGQDGWLVPPGSPRALAGALEMLLDNEPLRDRLALGAYERACRDFGTKLFAERLAAVYNSLTGGET
jgi:glycosyltransferase involved in cell wall biosynthesis